MFTGGFGMHYGIERIGATMIPASAGNTERHLMMMQDFGTTVLISTPSYALYMAEVAEKTSFRQKIVAAIDKTNQQTFAKANLTDPKDQTVANAAVKRLIRVDVDRDYFAGGTVGGGGDDRRRRGDGASNLTRRISNERYDVLHYRLAVVMPTSYLDELIRNLAERNYHTILSVRHVPHAQGERYYYGTEPVSLVELHGELLLLADWERGQWDEEEDAWSEAYPPLMPVEMLKRLEERGVEMRSADRRRIREQE